MTSKHEHIAGSLIHDILSARYQVNERLPSERDLAVRFDANRGAVREAMKKLEQIGLAEIQPGGARVKDKSEASLDVIGHLLADSEEPDSRLVEQILVVINSLLTMAAEQTLKHASDAEILHIQQLTRPLFEQQSEQKLDQHAHTLARFELFQSIMLSSNNLPLQLIARTLFEQFAPNMAPYHEFTIIDQEAYSILARQLHEALPKRDLPAVRATFSALSDLNTETMIRAIESSSSSKTGLEAMS